MPRISSVLPLMELLHAESVRQASRLGHGLIPELFGINRNGSPLGDAHRHAHWIPVCVRSPKIIDHVIVYSADRFSPEAVICLESITQIYSRNILPLSTRMIAFGSYARIERIIGRYCRQNGFADHRVNTSQVWQTTTPLVLRKYLHQRGKKTAEGQIAEELVERGFPTPRKIEIWSSRKCDQRWSGFVLRRRREKNQPPCARSWGATIHFERPIRERPLALGYASHLGLGRVRPIESASVVQEQPPDL